MKYQLAILLLFVSWAVAAQDIPVYKLSTIIVQPDFGIYGAQPTAVIQIPENAPARSATLDDALRSAPGVSVARSGGSGQPSSIFIRGSESRHTLVLLDGVEINDPGQPDGGFDFSTLDVNLVDRIEIYKGPQALRFGSGAMGGVINVVTKRGGGPLKARIVARTGSRQTNQGGAALLGSLGKLDYALEIARFESEGISAAKNGSEHDGHRYATVAAKLGYAWSEQTELVLTSRFLNSFSDLDFATSSAPSGYAVDDPNYHVRNRQLTHALNARSVWNEKFKSMLLAAHHHLDREYTDRPDAGNAGSFHDHRWSSIIKFENTNAFTPMPAMVINFGPSYRREEANGVSELYGIFSQLEWAKQNLSCEAGGRYDHHSTFGGHFSYAAGAGYRIDKIANRLRARVATGFKAPSLFQVNDPVLGNADLIPEKAVGEEISSEQELGGADRRLTLTAFRYHYRDLIQLTSRYKNLSRARAQGGEAELSWWLSPGWRAEGAYIYADARDLRSGDRLQRRPLHSWRLGLEGKFGSRAKVSLRYYGLGRRADIDALSAAPLETAAYDVLDLSMSYEFSRNLQFTASIENALNKDYEEISGYGTAGFGAYVGFRYKSQ